MLTSLYANLLSYLYPVGNTTAISLTQDLPLEKRADILLLGCGDLRHVLFTVHTDREIGQSDLLAQTSTTLNRPLDITSCDTEKAILARNVLLLSILIDDANNPHQHHDMNSTLCWNLYYHFRIDEASLNLLQSQAQKLHSASSSLQAWHASKYGKFIKVYDQGSLARMREMWKFYSIRRKGKELSRFNQRYQAFIQKSRQHNRFLTGDVNAMASVSPSPTWSASGKHLYALYKHYWKNGSMDLEQPVLSLTVHANPMFMSPDDNVVLHYGTNPLSGFHLTAAYVPLAPESPLLRTSATLALLKDVVEAAKTEFFAWIKSFRKRCHSVVLRVFVGDALAFSHALQHNDATRSPLLAHWYRDRFHFDPLRFEWDLISGNHGAPRTFDIIDTSNLADHVGSLNLLAAVTPLLACDASATLHCEILGQLGSTSDGLFNDFFCGPLSTISTLLGLVPVDYVTNASTVPPGDEVLLRMVMQGSDVKPPQLSQLFTRIAWKRPPHPHDELPTKTAPEQIDIHPTGLATIIYHVYVKMFKYENIAKMMTMTEHEWRELSLLAHQRASFAAFISLLKATVKADWQQTMRLVLDSIEANDIILSGTHIQELNVWLHLLNVYSVDQLKLPLPCSVHSSAVGDLRDWKDVPSVVCVTLEVPREKLKVFAEHNAAYIATPSVHCCVESDSSGRSRSNIFEAVQSGFGKVNCRGIPFSSSYEVAIVEDGIGWSGKSPLLISFFAPAWVLLQQPRTASVKFGLHRNPANLDAFLGRLGIELIVYQTTLGDTAHVYISKNLPNQIATMSTDNVSPCDTLESERERSVSQTTSATIDSATAEVVLLTGRVDLSSEKHKVALLAGAPVIPNFKTPFTFAISLPPKLISAVKFPAPVLESNLKIRIARKSSYVELVCRAANASDLSTSCNYMYPTVLDSGAVTLWNMPCLSLQSLPILDVRFPLRLKWLNALVSMMWTAKEKALREQPSLLAASQEQTKMGFKNSLSLIFTVFSGLEGPRAQMLGINCPTDGGIHILVFASSLRLDLSNRTVVLDAAVVPLHGAPMAQITSFLKDVSNRGLIHQITTTEAETRLWKQTLPAFVERCRTWSHKPECEYLSSRQVPLSFSRGQRLLCSCGEGTLPDNFITGEPLWKAVAQYAVRAAISPCFSATMFQNMAESKEAPQAGRETRGQRCEACGKIEGQEGANLLMCARCRRVKYCSRECQSADWKEHKAICKKSMR